MVDCTDRTDFIFLSVFTLSKRCTMSERSEYRQELEPLSGAVLAERIYFFVHTPDTALVLTPIIEGARDVISEDRQSEVDTAIKYIFGRICEQTKEFRQLFEAEQFISKEVSAAIGLHQNEMIERVRYVCEEMLFGRSVSIQEIPSWVYDLNTNMPVVTPKKTK